ncbi:hypothetical protein U27_01436 [Candidatus Vecturithrix granuli]|uniref:Uncharacterized protein n=1 Tax=Vecturithrix granuli TaxID=1499967 RepID=A0A081CAD0_VECG1|nr:hypothetical protein U27_01436 [Candidatus Vecturithrix granuli]
MYWTPKVKTLIKPWKGLKLLRRNTKRCRHLCENPNKTLEGIKTYLTYASTWQNQMSENPNKTLEGIKTHNS